MWYPNLQGTKKDYIYYKDLKDKLVNSHMIDLFANSGWKDGLVTGNSFYLKKIN